MKNKLKITCWPIQGILLALITLFFIQCKESSTDEQPAGLFDPSKPVSVTDFLPKEGGSGSNMVIYGDNFGNDVSRIKVVIGGKIAKVISVKGTSLYCIVPSLATEGDIKVYVLDEQREEELAHAEAREIFVYIPKWIVSDLVGTYYEVGSMFEEKEGPFGDCGAFKEMNWFTFDPKNPNRMYFAAENAAARIVDLEQRYVSYFRTPGVGRKSVILWKPDGDQDLITAENHSSDTRNAFHVYSRSSNFASSQVINRVARGVNGAAVHPVNGEMYYSLFRAGEVRRHDLTTGADQLAFQNPFSALAIYIVIHPSGDYAYITNSERHYILKSDYDYDRKIFKAPYPVAGAASTSGWVDGVGTNGRLNRPMQGVFVKNPDYEEQGGDQYDYYFCDRDNHCIRTLTPLGRVKTYAGRGNNGTSGYSNGDLRLEARFKGPCAIAHDEARNCFYVGDTGNWIIRKIALEGE
ncbi:IPT/TIG domain-containing protein [Sphingobacterium olei]|nr:IPT/TIG domain-containing protein [Sphingobacterium olei]